MTLSGPRVLDFTDSRRALDVDIVDGPAFELLVQLFVFTSGESCQDQEFAVGSEWFDRVRLLAGPDLLQRLRRLGCCGHAWFSLVGEAYDLEAPRSTAEFLKRIEDVDPIELRRRMLLLLCKVEAEGDDLVERAAAGDLEALDALEGDGAESGLRELFAMSPGDMKALLVGAVADFDHAVFQGGADVAGVLARDAEEKRSMARTMAPERLVEAATNGVTFAMQPEVSGIVLVPSVTVRPFVAITSYRRRRIFVYGVSDETLSADPSAPPSWLVAFYKALADERRLRILRMLGEGPVSLTDLTDRLGIAKSTVHHHLTTLRRAGLIRVIVGEEREYELRTDAVPEAGKLLDAYLGAPVPVDETEGRRR